MAISEETLFILMDYLIDTASKVSSLFCIFMESQIKISKFWCIYVPNDCFTLANSADPNEMLPYAAFHLGSALFAKVPVYPENG